MPSGLLCTVCGAIKAFLGKYCTDVVPSAPGVAARQRKAELERLNDQLRKINMSLRQQARAGTVYAPGLNYAPIPMPPSPFKTAAPMLEEQRIKTINGVQVRGGP